MGPSVLHRPGRPAASLCAALVLLVAGAVLISPSLAQQEDQEYYFPQDGFLAAELQEGGFSAQGMLQARNLLATDQPSAVATNAASSPSPKVAHKPLLKLFHKPTASSPRPVASVKVPSPSPKVASVLPKPVPKTPSPSPSLAMAPKASPQTSPKPSSSPAAKPLTAASLLSRAASAVNKPSPSPSPSPSPLPLPSPSPDAADVAEGFKPSITGLDTAPAQQEPAAAPTDCTLAMMLLGKCGAKPSPSPSPAPVRRPPPLPPGTFMDYSLANGSCNATLAVNGDFEEDTSMSATRLIGWAKIKENATTGGGGLFNGSDRAYSGHPGAPFNSSNRYFRTRQTGDIAFALVNNQPITVPNDNSWLYFDWFVDNPYPYYFIAETMSNLANGSNIVQHQVRVDLYDYDLLDPPGNYTDLAEQMFYQYDPRCCDAYVMTVLPPEAIAATGNLASMSTAVPLDDQGGRRLLLAVRYTTNVYNLAFGIDNVRLVNCKPGYMEAYTGLKDYTGTIQMPDISDVLAYFNYTSDLPDGNATLAGEDASS